MSSRNLDAIVSECTGNVMYYSRIQNGLAPNSRMKIKPSYLPALNHTGVDLSTISTQYEYPFLYKSSSEVVSRRTAICTSLRNPQSEQIQIYLNCKPVLSPLALKYKRLDAIREKNKLQIFKIMEKCARLNIDEAVIIHHE